MAVRASIVCLLSLLFVSATGSFGWADDGPRRLALLIGVNHYDNRNFEGLLYAERDMEELAKEIKGFYQARLLLGSAKNNRDCATKANLEQAVADLFASRLSKDDLVLSAFSGHGRQVATRGTGNRESNEPYFCPKDGVPSDLSTLFNLSRLIEQQGQRRRRDQFAFGGRVSQ
jgi:hypothetical protein